MPLYYFDVADNGVLVTDHFGVELADLHEAREQAIALLPDMARNEMPDGDRHEFSATVRCSGGRVRYEAKLVFQGRWVEPPSYDRMTAPPSKSGVGAVDPGSGVHDEPAPGAEPVPARLN